MREFDAKGEDPVAVRLSPKLRKKLKSLAEKNDRTISDEMRALIEKADAKEER